MSQQQPPPANTGAFIGALIAGFFSGGTILTFTVFLFGLGIAALGSGSTLVAVLISYAVAVGIGVLGFVLVRKNVGFLSGFVIGAAAGLLGGISVCNGIAGGLNNMH